MQNKTMSGYVKPYKQLYPDLLPCGTCKQFKPDDSFNYLSANTLRRKRAGVCRQCIKAQRDHRFRNKDLWKQRVFKAYGNKCACCGETQSLFLQIDHVNNNGAIMKKTKAHPTIPLFYLWLCQKGFPSEFQLLCANCNWGKARNDGVCPHKR
ncbi:MAG: hypothetical protein KGL39_19800 [Patescibacteria group bacterium]|nr:hypothetical protein [Patescibacteria group bacterium]